ncbi:MAG: T9SS type A sorting domain-containing protein, partial [Bacteroidota bacterium]
AANNGGGSDGEEFTFPAVSLAEGSFIYITTDNVQFEAFFGFSADYVSEGSNSAVGINGDDAVELFQNSMVADVFGDIDTDGSGEAWEYLDGWAYRIDGTEPDGSNWQIANWNFSGPDALDGEDTNATAATPFPIGSYTTTSSEFVNANDDSGLVATNGTITIDILSNDLIPGELTSLVIVDNGDIGLGTIVNNELQYSPFQDECGTDSLRYEVCNLIGCDTALVVIEIECIIDYPSFTIGEVTNEDEDGVTDSEGLKVKLQGIAYGVNLRPGGLQFALIDAAGDGITVFSFIEDFDYFMQEGDELIIQGAISQFGGLTEVIPETLEVVSQGNSLLTPQTVTALNEDTESRFVRLENVSIVDAAQWTNEGPGFNVDVTDGINTYSVRIDNDVDIFGTDPPSDPFNVTGIGTQFDEEVPLTEGYSIIPRYLPDLDIISNTIEPAFAEAIELFPNPVVGEWLEVSLKESFEQVIISDYLGRQLNVFKQVNGRLSVDVSTLSSGVYAITLKKEGRTWTERFVKQ